MTKFFLKKNIADGWDNVLQLIVPNFVIVTVVALIYMAVSFVAVKGANDILPFLTLAALFPVLQIFIFAFGKNALSIANFETASLKSYFSSIPKAIIPGFGFGLIISLISLGGFLSVPYYWRLFKTGSWLGLIIAAFIVWFLIISFMSLQWFIPLYFLQDYNGFKKSLKKSFIIFFDNPWFSVFEFLYSIVLAVISVFLIFLLPGFAGILLSQMNALRLRLRKYDWWEENPEIAQDPDKRYEVPWNTLLKDDIETLGPRKLKSFLFPWQ